MNSSWMTRLTRNSDQRVRALLWGIIVWQFCIWFSHYWLPITTQIVMTTLVLMLAGEWLWIRQHAWKRLFQMISVLAVSMWLLDYHWIGFTPESWGDLLIILALNGEQLLPFIWYGMGAAIVYLTILVWATTKLRSIILFLFTVIVLCIADSFTKFILWDQIAWTVLAGLLLLILHHFSTFRDRHPHSWQYIMEYPSAVAVPIVLLVGLVMLAGWLAPSVRPLMTDPYTAWKQSRGEPVAKLGKGYSGEAKNPERSAFSGYSRNNEVLGGGFTYDYSEVMTITTDRRSYWRGETRTTYTGTGWAQHEADQWEEYGVGLEEELFQDIQRDERQAEWLPVHYSVTMNNEVLYPVLFGVHAISAVTQIEGEDREQLESYLRWQPTTDTMRWQASAEFYPARYALTSKVAIRNDEALRLAYSADHALEEWADSVYVQLPDTVTERVRELAAEVTAQSENVYDQVVALETYLSQTYPYTNEPDRSKAQSDDFVDQFLFEVMEGYCDYYSTSMVVMLRSLGIPARWVKGYTSGTIPYMDDLQSYFMEETQSDKDGAGTYVVRNSDAHSWVEVYFPGWGWLPFEPTAGFSMPVATATEEVQTPLLPESELPLSEDVPAKPEASRGAVFPWLWTVLIVSLVAGVTGIIAWRIGWLPALYHRLSGRRAGADDYRRLAVLEFEKFLRYAARKGYRRRRFETIREWAAASGGDRSWLRDDLLELAGRFEQVKYSESTVTIKESDALMQLIGRLREKMK